MYIRNTLKRICSASLAMLLLGSVSAYAERPSGSSAVKGSTPAQSLTIDTSAYTDPSLYENPPHGVETMRIGLMYGDGADSEAVIKNLSGGGFLIGSFDEERNFHESSKTGYNELIIRIKSSGGSWRVLLHDVFSSQTEAESAAAESGGSAVKLNGDYRIILGDFVSKSDADSLIKQQRLEGSAYYDGVGSILVYGDDGDKLIYSSDEDVGSVALLPNAENRITEFKGNHYRGGFECLMHDAEHLNLINYVGLEDYVKGVIPYEMSYSWPIEALKAQAVCARTYAVYNQNRFAHYGFDLTADTYSQVYRGTLEANELSDSAVDDTEGELIRYKGEVCEIYYCSSNGGATEDGINVFDTDAPYLSGKTDPFEAALDYPLKDWELIKSDEQILNLLHKQNYEISDISRIEPEYSDTGNVIAIRYYDKNENCLEIRGRSCYTSIGLNSCRFSLSRDEDDNYVFSGKGWGHSCGMSQWGANAMASVYGYNYQDILRFYFSGVYIT